MTRGAAWSRRALATAAGLTLDRMLGEPPDALHPVAGFGRLMGRVEERWWANRRPEGVAYTAAGVGMGLMTGTITRSTTAAVAITCAGRELRATATRIGALLEQGDIDGAREALPALVGRDPTLLNASEIAAAVIESLAENTVDAVIAPAFWGFIAGAPGAWSYRAVNTMDAMVGHRSDRYLRFGWSSARLDDLANLVPSRLTAALVVVCRPQQARTVTTTVRRDGRRHPSPNAGVAESAFAAALDLQLGGPLRYGDRSENRPQLGDGRRPQADDIARAVVLADHVEGALVGMCIAAGLLGETLRRRPPRSQNR